MGSAKHDSGQASGDSRLAIGSLRAAEGYLELGMIAEARAELACLPPDEDKSADALKLRMILLLKEGAWKEALGTCERLLAVSPKSVGAHIQAAYCLHELGDTKAARDRLITAPESLHSEPIYHYNLACYHAVLGALGAARLCLGEAFSRDADLRRTARKDSDLRALWGEI